MTTAPMMAAMMLPGALPAVVTQVRSTRRLRRATLFAASYFAVWLVVGLALEMLWPSQGLVVAGVVTIAAGLYEVTPFKRDCRRRCREEVRSGLDFGLNCVGSSIGLMAMFAALGVMSMGWMAAVAAVVVAQKVLPPARSIDLPLAAAIVALGVVVAVEPSWIPGLQMM
jgi:predicted metal-binding membrane protein